VSYEFSWPLQQALFAALTADPAVQALADGRVFDAAPHADEGGAAGPCVLIGDETVEPWSTATDRGAEHVVTLSAVGPERGFGPVKRLAGAVCDAALGPLAPSRGRVVNSSFLGARAVRTQTGRRIDMRFRIVIEE
jgi:hypothetical protein